MAQISQRLRSHVDITQEIRGLKIEAYTEVGQSMKASLVNKTKDFMDQISNRWKVITKWFEVNEKEMVQVRDMIGRRVEGYPDGDKEAQRRVNQECMALTKRFLDDCQIRYPTNKLELEWVVHPKAMAIIGELLNDISIEAASDGPKLKSQEKEERLDSLASKCDEFFEAIQEGLDIPADIVWHKTTRSGRPILWDMISANIGGEQLRKHPNQLDRVLADLEGNPEPTKERVALINEVRMSVEQMHENLMSEIDDGGQSMWSAQEANLCRVLQMCWIFRGMPVDVFQDCILRIGFIARRTVGEQKMIDALSTSTFIPLRNVADRIDGIGAGRTREAHKYQHPFLVTMKRFMNALCCVLPLSMPASILNGLPMNENASMIIAMAYVIDVNTSTRAMERNSMAIFYQHLKGCSEPGMYTGFVVGSVIKVRTRVGKNTPFKVTAKLYRLLQKIACNASATDESLLAAIGVGTMPNEVPPNTIFRNINRHSLMAAEPEVAVERFTKETAEAEVAKAVLGFTEACSGSGERSIEELPKVIQLLKRTLAGLNQRDRDALRTLIRDGLGVVGKKTKEMDKGASASLGKAIRSVRAAIGAPGDGWKADGPDSDAGPSSEA